MSFQHQGIHPALLLCQRTEGDGTGDVRRTILILRPAVQQEESFGLQHRVSLGCRLVMHDGTMRLIAGDGVEGETAVEGLLST